MGVTKDCSSTYRKRLDITAPDRTDDWNLAYESGTPLRDSSSRMYSMCLIIIMSRVLPDNNFAVLF